MNMVANILSIAGSDPSGGAGIQADLKAISASHAYGMAVITCLTAQNTKGVQESFPVPADFVAKQIQSLIEDIHIDAIKIGMLGTADIIEAVYKQIKDLTLPIILDPVMISKSGHRLLQEKALNVLKKKLLPLATILTPNLPEAADLLGQKEATSLEEAEAQGKSLLKFGPNAILMKGGHFEAQDSTDLLITPSQTLAIPGKRWKTKNTHGTGCSLSAAIASLLGQGKPLSEAVIQAKDWLNHAIQHADLLKIGQGCGPVHHFYALWEKDARRIDDGA
ncbi:bifunctional hydroxymethylpyrimidine kinase/phosphomethylpyrimidine kinase [Acetobacteraceae bacterium]|nr:bifunctional hydroxymethylpyrimidine kinase/phosphomethylpyrimidine kinase [Acetobacteraceae bacterium]